MKWAREADERMDLIEETHHEVNKSTTPVDNDQSKK